MSDNRKCRSCGSYEILGSITRAWWCSNEKCVLSDTDDRMRELMLLAKLETTDERDQLRVEVVRLREALIQGANNCDALCAAVDNASNLRMEHVRTTAAGMAFRLRTALGPPKAPAIARPDTCLKCGGLLDGNYERTQAGCSTCGRPR